MLFYTKAIIPQLLASKPDKETSVETQSVDSHSFNGIIEESAAASETQQPFNKHTSMSHLSALCDVTPNADEESTNDLSAECYKASVFCPVYVLVCINEIKSIKESSIGCDKCGEWFHYECVGIKTKKQVRMAEQLEWFCEKCK